MDTKFPNEVNFLTKAVEKDFANVLDPKTAQRFATNLEMAAWGVDLAISWKNLNGSVGAKAIELRRNGRPAKRCVFVVEGLGKVVVLHVFIKTCEGVDRHNMNIAKQRYKQWLETKPVAA